MKPADLTIGDRISTAIGVLVVSTAPWENFSEDTPQFDRVVVDVEVEDRRRFGDPVALPGVAGASEFSWLGMTPTLRYRLAFLPGADVEVER